MKGLVFREFLDMVDKVFSPEITELIISKSDLPSGGAYTSVGTYDHNEILTLVSALSTETGCKASKLVYSFGRYLFGRFRQTHPHFFADKSDAFEFLESVDGHIHVEVRKLYPNAELPSLSCSRPQDGQLIVNYESGRSMGDLAHGLIDACIENFTHPIDLAREDVSDGATQQVRFALQRRASAD